MELVGGKHKEQVEVLPLYAVFRTWLKLLLLRAVFDGEHGIVFFVKKPFYPVLVHLRKEVV